MKYLKEANHLKRIADLEDKYEEQPQDVIIKNTQSKSGEASKNSHSDE